MLSVNVRGGFLPPLVCQIKVWGEKPLERNPSQAYGCFVGSPPPARRCCCASLLPSAPQQQQDRAASVFEAVAWMISSEPDLRFPCRRSYDRDGNKITQTRGENGCPATFYRPFQSDRAFVVFRNLTGPRPKLLFFWRERRKDRGGCVGGRLFFFG